MSVFPPPQGSLLHQLLTQQRMSFISKTIKKKLTSPQSTQSSSTEEMSKCPKCGQPVYFGECSIYSWPITNLWSGIWIINAYLMEGNICGVVGWFSWFGKNNAQKTMVHTCFSSPNPMQLSERPQNGSTETTKLLANKLGKTFSPHIIIVMASSSIRIRICSCNVLNLIMGLHSKDHSYCISCERVQLLGQYLNKTRWIKFVFLFKQCEAEQHKWWRIIILWDVRNLLLLWWFG